MDYLAIKKRIDTGNIAPIYFFFGEEQLLIEEIIETLSSRLLQPGLGDFNNDVFFGSDASEDDIIERCLTYPHFSGMRLVVVKNAEYLPCMSAKKDSKKDDMLLKYCSSPSPTTCLVLISYSNKRKMRIPGDLLKAAMCHEFKCLRGGQLKYWIREKVKQNEYTIESSAIETLIEFSGENLLNLKNELEKLFYISEGRKKITLEDVENVCGVSRSGRIYDMLDSISRRDVASALPVLDRLLFEGENPLRISTMIQNRIRLMYKMKILKDEGRRHSEIAGILREHDFVIKKLYPLIDVTTSEDLKNALYRLHELDILLKSSRIPHETLLGTYVLNLCNSPVDIWK